VEQNNQRFRHTAKLWKGLAQAGAGILCIITGFALPAPFGSSRADESASRGLASFVVAVLVGLLFVAGQRFALGRHLRWWWSGSAAFLIISTSAFIGYLYLSQAWSCSYNNKVVLIGNVETSLAENRKKAHPSEQSCEDLLMAASGHVDWVYTKESIERCRIILEILYVAITPFLALCVIGVVQAIYIHEGKELEPNQNAPPETRTQESIPGKTERQPPMTDQVTRQALVETSPHSWKSPATLCSGDRVGPYTLLNKLGRGSFGVIWLAERRTVITSTQVAIKIPHTDEIDLEAIRREAQLWVRAAGHPNVLPIIEANIYDDYVIIASEYAPDGSLKEWLDRHGGAAPGVDVAVEMTRGILNGLEHLHAKSIIHRDLKPENILLQGDTPRLADFGISRAVRTGSQSATIAGTPAYMAPEAFQGKRNEQTDLWAVGAILYELVSGHLPFQGSDLPSLIGAIVTQEPTPLPEPIPLGVKNVINRSLNKEMSRRYTSASEMRAELLAS
jgi:tRNA A-37 threonylcarbamoyl transferase component Bud32